MCLWVVVGACVRERERQTDRKRKRKKDVIVTAGISVKKTREIRKWKCRIKYLHINITGGKIDKTSKTIEKKRWKKSMIDKH